MILGFAGVGFMAYRRRNHAPALAAADASLDPMPCGREALPVFGTQN
ncbi:hypothetical protein WHZ78_07430 [Bradyrhizobium symbiodeficiens]